MSNVVQLKPAKTNKTDIYSRAMNRRSKRNGVDYNALYSGDPVQKEAAKKALVKLHKKQSLESWMAEG